MLQKYSKLRSEKRRSRGFYENDIHDKYSQGENGDFPYPPGLSQRRSCRYPDLDSASVGAEAGGPFREWAKVKLVGGTAPC